MPVGARPQIILNLAISADGKIASANRRVNHFSGAADEHQLYTLRATVDGIMNGARTVDSAPVKMDAGPAKFRRLRLKSGLSEQPLRIVISGSGSLRSDAEIFQHTFSPIVVVTSQRCRAKDRQRLENLATTVIVAGRNQIDLPQAITEIQERWPVKRLLCEGGGALNDALFRADLVDEINLTVCPVLIGGKSAPTLSDGEGFANLSEARRFELVSRKRRGDEMFLRYRSR
ncbi:MAG: RibD family protein [Verrucomicrobiia bacterium]|jgi:riboflavin-specific deaminase-like protein